MNYYELHRHSFLVLFQDYELDGIDWTKVEFEDNQKCLDVFEKVFIWLQSCYHPCDTPYTHLFILLISLLFYHLLFISWWIVQKPLGLMSLLDEESNLPKATDLTFASKLKQHLNSNSCFRGERGRAFRIRHYAGEVSYCSVFKEVPIHWF